MCCGSCSFYLIMGFECLCRLWCILNCLSWFLGSVVLLHVYVLSPTLVIVLYYFAVGLLSCTSKVCVPRPEVVLFPCRHSSYNVKAEIRLPIASEISTAILAHRYKAVTAVDPYISKNTESFSLSVRCTALNKKLTRYWYFYVHLVFSVPSYFRMIQVIS